MRKASDAETLEVEEILQDGVSLVFHSNRYVVQIGLKAKGCFAFSILSMLN